MKGVILIGIFLSGVFAVSFLTFQKNEKKTQEEEKMVQDTTGKTERSLLSIEGMTCEGCAMTIKRTLLSIEGVKKAEVSYKDKKADVLFVPEKVSDSLLIEKINKIGYKANLIETDTLENSNEK